MNKSRLRKNLIFVIFILSTILTISIVRVRANTEDNGPIYDPRCSSEMLINPDGCYVTGYRHKDNGDIDNSIERMESANGFGCSESGNTESYIKELVNFCKLSESDTDTRFDDGSMSIFKTTVNISGETLPLIFRIVIFVGLGALGITALVITIIGINKWMVASFNGDDISKLPSMYVNGLWGLFFSIGSFMITWLVFWGLGYRDNPFDLDTYVDVLFSIDCESIVEETECRKYDLSCSFVEDLTGPVNEQDKMCIKKSDLEN